ncbi:hypothetical protein M758_2G070800 [Ceratodon purpureus]|nr:hypothetical protein M758_2G070800 [Ceratodon purpureus]
MLLDLGLVMVLGVRGSDVREECCEVSLISIAIAGLCGDCGIQAQERPRFCSLLFACLWEPRVQLVAGIRMSFAELDLDVIYVIGAI